MSNMSKAIIIIMSILIVGLVVVGMSFILSDKDNGTNEIVQNSNKGNAELKVQEKVDNTKIEDYFAKMLTEKGINDNVKTSVTNATNFEAVGVKENVDKDLLSTFKKYPYGYSVAYTRNYGVLEGITEEYLQEIAEGTIKNIEDSGIMKYVDENNLDGQLYEFTVGFQLQYSEGIQNRTFRERYVYRNGEFIKD